MAKLTDFLGRPHSGVVPYAVTALVVDNVDPDELGRILVKFPTLVDVDGDMPLSFWLRQASPNAGKERGFYALPEKDDEVLVIFMQGSQDVGIIIGQFWNGKDLPPKECKDKLPAPSKSHAMKWSADTFTSGTSDLKLNDRRFWKSRSGHLFVFDDSKGKETVQIWDGKHVMSLIFDGKEQRVLLTNSGKDMHIRTERDLFLEAGRDIKWKAGRDLVGEADRHIDEHAKMTYKFKADQTITMESGTDTTHKVGTSYTMQAGTTATLKASAQMTLKAGIININ